VLGLSFSEVVVIAIVALVAVGPQKLPGLLRTLGTWGRKLRMMSHEMRAQSGIDDVLKAEGLQGGLHELRSLMRGQASFYNPATPYSPPPQPVTPPAPPPPPEPAEEDPYADVGVDVSREYPPEGPDAYGAIADDLLDDEPLAANAESALDPPRDPDLLDAEPETVNGDVQPPPPPLQSAEPTATDSNPAPVHTISHER
jgi:sec-independent protein translocase protein TatB